MPILYLTKSELTELRDGDASRAEACVEAARDGALAQSGEAVKFLPYCGETVYGIRLTEVEAEELARGDEDRVAACAEDAGDILQRVA